MKTSELQAAPTPTANLSTQTETTKAIELSGEGRRSFLKGLGMAGAAITAGMLLTREGEAAVRTHSAALSVPLSGPLSAGDTAILRFLAAAEIIETDLWTQYAELGGQGGGNPAYMAALSNLDGDMPQYISDNTDDELSHASFLDAYLKSRGAAPVNLDRFRTLPSSQATGAKQIGRLTNLMNLNVDTSWYTRYRSGQNPDLGAVFTGPFPINNQPAIPLNDADTPPNQPQPVPPLTAQESRMQAIANAAGFHFAMIEQGGSSLYASMAMKAHEAEVLQIVISIGGVEIDHFGLWHDKAGNAVNSPLAGVTDPETGVHFPNLNTVGAERSQTNLILPEPCSFLNPSLPPCSVIRPTSDALGGAVAAVNSLTANQLFQGQSQAFFDFVMGLAVAADAAQRGF